MRCQIIAELATGHGGDVVLACEMVHAAAEAGADWVKIQTYDRDRINPNDKQAEWLRQAWLDNCAHDRIRGACESARVRFLSTPFDPQSLEFLRSMGLKTFKIASSEASNVWWLPLVGEHWVVSRPWGRWSGKSSGAMTNLTAIPLYPTSLECVASAPLLDGWSDHTETLDASLYAIARGAKMVEVHFCLPGKGRNKSFDKSPDGIRLLREFAESVATMTVGVSQQFRDRWSA